MVVVEIGSLLAAPPPVSTFRVALADVDDTAAAAAAAGGDDNDDEVAVGVFGATREEDAARAVVGMDLRGVTGTFDLEIFDDV